MGQDLSDLFPRDPDEPIDNTYHGYGITAAPLGSGTIHPVAMTLEDVMKVCWRIRRWDVQIVTSFGNFYIFGWQTTLGGTNTNERDIPLTTLARPFGAYDSIGSLDPTQDILFDGALCATSLGRAGDPVVDYDNTENVTRDGDDFYPSFFVAFTLSQETPTSEFEVFSTYDDGTASGPTGTMDFFGYDIDLYYYSGGSTVASVTMIPSTVADSWWPYAPTSGGLAVFDDEDGTQINPNIVVDKLLGFLRGIWKQLPGSGLLVPA